jgi:hypothetical protein
MRRDFRSKQLLAGVRDFAVTRGFEHLRDDVIDVLHDETGAIAALHNVRVTPK